MTNTFPLQVTELAADQIRAAAAWWHENRTAVSRLLTEELEAAFRLLTFQPLAGPLVPDAPRPGIRRDLLRKCQYHLYYRFDPATGVVVVLAFWATRRGYQPDL